MFKNIKTPHGRNPLNHARNLWLYFVGAAALTIGMGIGATASGPMSLLCAALLTGSVCILAGVGTTAFVRRAFNLIQTGRVVQYAGFAFAGYLGFLLTGAVMGSVTVASPLLAGLVTFALAFATATAAKEIPWRGRTWLPRRQRV